MRGLRSSFSFALLSLWVSLAIAGNQIIIKFKPTAVQQYLYNQGRLSNKCLRAQQMCPLTTKQLAKIERIIGMSVTDLHAIGTGAHIILLQCDLDNKKMQQVLYKLKADNDIVYAEVNNTLKP